MNLIQSCIDLAQHIRASEDLSPSGTAKNEIEAIGNANIISQDVQEQMEQAVGFRNILAHRYGDVNHDVVYAVLHDDLHWFDKFQQEIAQWVQGSH
jgi:uncharacterized protein YutE (UPF0331/DUF86 family)